MKTKATIQGRSFLFNALFVLLNLTGLTFVTMGNHDHFEAAAQWMQLLGYGLLLASTAGLFVFRGRLMMAGVSRVLVGGLFIVSGLVKANDPIGFSYKLEEYFEDGALAFRIKEWFGAPGFSLEFLIDSALTLSVLICIVEIILGILIIIGGKVKLVSYLTVLMMLFFTFLTWHTSNCDPTHKFLDRDTYSMTDPVAAMKLTEAESNPDLKIVSNDGKTLVVEEKKLPQCVDDCGCFGDAMKGSVGRSLTPKESLWKDLVVLYLVLWIFAAQWVITPNTRRENMVFTIASLLVVTFFSWVFSWYFPLLFALAALIGALWIRRAGGKLLGNYWGSILIVALISGIFVFFVLRYEPMKDYRPYAVGTNLVEKMNDGVEGVYENMLRYKNSKTGEERLYDAASKEYMDSKIWEDKDWKYVDMVQKVIVPTKIPSITEQFNPFLSLENLTDTEREMEYVSEFMAKNSVSVIQVRNNASEDVYDVPIEEFTYEEYDTVNYTVLDTVNQLSGEISDITIRDFIITAPEIVVISAKNLDYANWDQMDRYRAIIDGCQKRGIPVVVICNGSREQIDAFRTKHSLNVPVFMNDETELKAIARSNPAMLIIQKGTVAAKYPHRSTPTFDWLIKNVLKTK